MDNKKPKKCYCKSKNGSKNKFCLSKCSNVDEKKECSCSKFTIVDNKSVKLLSFQKGLYDHIISQITNLSNSKDFLSVKIENLEYFIPISEKKYIIWGREVIGEIVEICIFALNLEDLGRLVFQYKQSELIKVSFNSVMCPAIYIKHCDQYNEISYVRKELEMNTKSKKDIQKINFIFSNDRPSTNFYQNKLFTTIIQFLLEPINIFKILELILVLTLYK